MQYRSFFIYLAIFISLPAKSDEFESTEKLRKGVEQFLTQKIMSVQRISSQDDVKVHASNIEPRLRLKKCRQKAIPSITSRQPYGTNVSVKLQCAGPQPWSIYVPAKIQTYTEVAVLSRSLERGAILSENDISLQRMDTSLIGHGYVKNISRLVGMQLKRSTNEGQALRLSHVKATQMIKRGDKVVLEASTKSLSVVTMGKALSSGVLGQQIQVRNTHSKRIIDGKVVAPGRVLVLL